MLIAKFGWSFLFFECFKAVQWKIDVRPTRSTFLGYIFLVLVSSYLFFMWSLFKYWKNFFFISLTCSEMWRGWALLAITGFLINP